MRKFFVLLLVLASLVPTVGRAQEDADRLENQLPDGWSTYDDGPAQRLREKNKLKASGSTTAALDSIIYAQRTDSTRLTAPIVDLNKQIYSFDVDKEQNHAVLCFAFPTGDGKWQPEGELVVYDLREGKVLWNKIVNLADYELSLSMKALRTGTASVMKLNPLRMTRYGLLHKTGSKITMLDAQTGEQLWKMKGYPVYYDDSQDVMLNYTSATSAHLQGTSLSTGKKLWTMNASHSRNWGWDEALIENDSLIVVAADELHFLNPLSGQVTTHEALTGTKDASGTIALLGLAALSAVSAATTGFYYIPTGGGFGQDVTTHLVSNIYKQDDRYYLADREQLRCFDKHGNLMWASSFPSKTAACSQLSGSNGQIRMASFGFGLKGGVEMHASGRPFLATFDAMTGDELSMQFLSEKKKMVEGAVMDEAGTFLMTHEALAYQSASDTAVVGSAWNAVAYGHPVDMPTDTIYTYRKNDTALTPLHADGQHCIVMTDKGKMLVVDKELNIVDDYQSGNVYRICHRYGSLDFVTNNEGDDCWIVEQSGRPVARLTVPVRMVQLVGSTLYIASETSLFSVNLNEIE